MRDPRLIRNTVLVTLFLAAIVSSAGAGAWLARASAQQDFAAYYVAGAARRAGLDPYVNYAGAPGREGLWDGVAVFAHSRFLYPPLVADLFRPLAALPYAVAKALFTAGALALFLLAAVVSARMFDRAARPEPALTVLAGALSFPLYIHLDRGQIDVAALVLLVAAWALAARRPVAAGAALAGAALLKPALAGLVPIVAALGRWRAAAAAVACAAALAALTAAVSGPGLLVEYATVVLPRAARFGEGGTRDMLLPAERQAAIERDLDARGDGTIRIGGRWFTLSTWDGPVSASLPRLLAPDGPTPLAGTVPGLVALVGLAAAAREVRRRARPPAAHALLFFAAAVACVVTSPAGWAMGLVAALPLVPLLVAGRREATVGRGAGRALGAALIACACPPLFAGWPALAGAAVVVTAAIAAVGHP